MAGRVAGALILRRARPEDGADMAAIYAPYVRDTLITFETEAPDATEMARRITYRTGSNLPWIVAQGADGTMLGYAYAGHFHVRHAYRFTVEPSVYLTEAARGRGVGRQLYERLFTILSEQGFRQAVALIALPNPASVTLHERFGFRHTGTHERVGHKLGGWIDVGLYQRAVDTGDAPLTLDDPLPLEASASWTALS
ncbi:MAG TPA: GNAT family N-acetyltransferase [Sphingobium sp.]|uniref:GNAT family N-acetyltransferase n=1 Tax=Sphingobium sp. TaxID=1912891 RepID=UPI002ED1B277